MTCSSSKMPLYLLRICLENLSFRLPSLYSIADLFNFDIRIVSEDPHRGVLVVELEKEEHVDHILDRGIQVM